MLCSDIHGDKEADHSARVCRPPGLGDDAKRSGVGLKASYTDSLFADDLAAVGLAAGLGQLGPPGLPSPAGTTPPWVSLLSAAQASTCGGSPVVEAQRQHLQRLQQLQQLQHVELQAQRQTPPPSAASAAQQCIWRCGSPVKALACPQPRRAFIPVLEGGCNGTSNAPASPATTTETSRRDLQELLGLSAGGARPSSGLSSLSTNVGPTPSPDEAGTLFQQCFLDGCRSASPQEEPWMAEAAASWPCAPLWLDSEGLQQPLGVATGYRWPQIGQTSPDDLPMRVHPTPPPSLDDPHTVGPAAAELTAAAPGKFRRERRKSAAGGCGGHDVPVQPDRQAASCGPRCALDTPVAVEPRGGRGEMREAAAGAGAHAGGAGSAAAEKPSGKRGQRSARGGDAQEQAAGSDNQQPLTKERVLQMSTREEGSKTLQRLLLKGHPSVIEDIIDGICDHLPTLMCDVYGNYLCSAAFQACSVGQRKRMLQIALSELHALATNKRATHALQALVSFMCTADEQRLLFDALRGCISELACDTHATHVVQRALLTFGKPFDEWIVREVASSLHSMAQDPRGVSVLKKCISMAKDTACQRLFLTELCLNAVTLVQGSYGNYVVQHAMEAWGGEVCWPLTEALRGRLVQLSTHKFSSNVVEQMLRIAPPAQCALLAQELANPAQFDVLMSSVYGRYVVARVLQACSAELRVSIRQLIARGLSGVRDRQLRSRWKELLADDNHPLQTQAKQP